MNIVEQIKEHFPGQEKLREFIETVIRPELQKYVTDKFGGRNTYINDIQLFGDGSVEFDTETYYSGDTDRHTFKVGPEYFADPYQYIANEKKQAEEREKAEMLAKREKTQQEELELLARLQKKYDHVLYPEGH